MTTHQRPFTDIIIPKKPKMLLVVEPQQPGTEDDGMHLVRIPNSGYQVCCNASTEEDCVACGRPTCPAHFSTRTLYVQDCEGHGSFALCWKSAQLLREELEIIRQLRLSLNS
jgi:hypothetical protein